MTRRYVAINCVLPLVIGGMIYLLWRSDDMLMFKCADAIGLSPAIYAGRGSVGAFSEWIPDIILFSLPDAVWVYSGTAFFSRLWHDAPRIVHIGWSSIFAVLAIGSEIGQLAGLVPGTFDVMDAWLCAVAAICGNLVASKRFDAIHNPLV